MRQLPQINEIQKKLKDKGFVALAIAVQDSEAKVKKLADDKEKWAVKFALDPNVKAAQAFGVSSIPAGFLIDTEGKIRDIHAGPLENEGKDLEKKITPLLPKKVAAN